MDSGLDSVAFSNSSEDVNFIQESSPNFKEVRNKKNNALLRQIFLSGIVLLCFMICIVILIWCNWLKLSIHAAAATNLTLCPSSSSTYKIELEMELRRRFVREMMLDSWNAYERYAWGHEALKPVSKTVYNGAFGNHSGLSMVTSMSTLWTMGLMEEFQKGKKWIETKLDLSKLDRSVRVFDVVTHYVGGLLFCYALTNDSMFLNKAKQVGQLMEPAFNTTTGIPYKNIYLNSSELSGKNSHLSYISGFQVDFNYLNDAANETKYRNMINKIRQNLREIEKPKNLYYSVINIENYWTFDASCMSIMCRELYISLVNSYIQSNHLDVQSIEMYKEAMDAVEAVKMINVSSDGLVYAQAYIYDTYDNYSSYSEFMEYGTCYLGAMLSMGANAMQQALTMNKSIGGKSKSKELYRIHHHWELAEKLTETCHFVSSQTKTGLGPHTVFYNHPLASKMYQSGNYLSSEFAESNFVQWRLTRDPKYRDYAWEMTLAIKRFCKIESGGYSTIANVDQIPTDKSNYQPAHFLSATLKYLYLTFTDDDVLPLDQWVFNAQGHPLPICGKNPVYPSQMCAKYY